MTESKQGMYYCLQKGTWQRSCDPGLCEFYNTCTVKIQMKWYYDTGYEE